jgi:two-component sensor histidine kinase
MASRRLKRALARADDRGVSTSAQELQVDLTLRPTWDLIPAVRTFVEQALAPVIKDADLGYRLSMATHELLENAVKYATKPTATLSVSVGGGPHHATITLSNEADQAHIDDLHVLFAEMTAAADPIVYYCELMRRYAGQRHVSRLGLARIQAEGEMRLSLTTNAGRVTIKAEANGAGGETRA